MKYRPNFLPLLFAASLLLSGCASMSNTPPQALQTGAVQTHHYHDSIEFSGKLLIRYQQNDKEQSLPGSFEWKQDKDSTTVTLLTPTGQTAAVIIVNADGATLLQAKQEAKHARDLDSLLDSTLGWSMPIAGLRDWLQGFIFDAQGKRVAIESGKDTTVRTNGWQLRYATWQDDSTEAIPKRLDLNRYTQEAGDVSLRIVIVQWKAT